MIRASAVVAFVLSAGFLAGCQMTQNVPAGPAIEGTWASGDGISRTSFQGGQFTTQFVGTNEMIAQGSYTIAANSIAMQWLSFRDKTQRSATCSVTSANTMRCSDASGSSFDLNRIG